MPKKRQEECEMPKKKERQEECEDGNQQMDNRSGLRVAKSKTTGRRRVEGGSKVRPLGPRVAAK